MKVLKQVAMVAQNWKNVNGLECGDLVFRDGSKLGA